MSVENFGPINKYVTYERSHTSNPSAGNQD